MKRLLIASVCAAALVTLPALGAAAQTPSINDPSKSPGDIAKPVDGSMMSKKADDPSFTKIKKGSAAKRGMKKKH